MGILPFRTAAIACTLITSDKSTYRKFALFVRVDGEGKAHTYGKSCYRESAGMMRCLSAVLAITFVAFTAHYAFSTSCIQSKRFKAMQVCGVVVAPEGTPMPHVRVELIDLNTDLPDLVQIVETDDEGRFALPDTKAGEYALRVRLSGFATASQEFVVKPHRVSSACKKPIRVQMQVAGRCSTISVHNEQ